MEGQKLPSSEDNTFLTPPLLSRCGSWPAELYDSIKEGSHALFHLISCTAQEYSIY